jgi:hypothetical protein
MALLKMRAVRNSGRSKEVGKDEHIRNRSWYFDVG